MDLSRFPFIHLNVFSSYSLLHSTLSIDIILDFCKKHKMPAVAMTDRCNLFGAMEFALKAAKQGIQPIIGCSCSIVDVGEVILLVQTEEGYRNLSKLLSELYCHRDNGSLPLIPMDLLFAHAEGLILVTYRFFQDRDFASCIKKMQSVFAQKFFIGLTRLSEKDREKEKDLLAVALLYDIPIVALQPSFFLQKEDFEAYKVLVSIEQGILLENCQIQDVTEFNFLMAPEAMVQLFEDLPEALENTVLIAQLCSFILKEQPIALPQYPFLQDETPEEALSRLAFKGLEKRGKNDNSEFINRLNYELDIIHRTGFSSYFLVVSDFITYAKKKGIPVGPGRGSGAGSLVAYVLEITDIDPIRFDLLFERFLNPERVSLPDFDIDFCQDRRDEVVQYVYETYGADKVAQIITFGKMQARAVVRDVGRVLGIHLQDVDRLCRLIPNNPAAPVLLIDAVAGEPALQEMIRENEDIKRCLDLCYRLEGLYRHVSTHAAGLVISGKDSLYTTIPLYKEDGNHLPVTQFSMKYVESAGLVKFDLLGLKTLTVIQDILGLILSSGGSYDFSNLRDEKTYQLLSSGDTVGVFQMESEGMRDVIAEMQPDCLEDLVAIVSLYRPGPMDNIPDYIARKRGVQEVHYAHPLLEGVLQETYGIPIYQEQVMRMAQVLAGYTLGSADILRRAMGKKNKEEMDQQREVFCAGAWQKNAIDEKIAHEIFDQMNAFAGYGFNKSHATAYAYIAFQTAYLKAHYLVEFLTASMTADIHNTDKLFTFFCYARSLKVKIYSPDINMSGTFFSIFCTETQEKGIYYALSAIKGVGIQASEQIVMERMNNGLFKSFSDFVNRVPTACLNRRLLQHLIEAGCFDSLGKSRRYYVDHLNDFLNQRGSTLGQQASLFSHESCEEEEDTGIEYSLLETMKNEKKVFGFYFSGHPIQEYRRFNVPHRSFASVTGDGVFETFFILEDLKKIRFADGTTSFLLFVSDDQGVYAISLSGGGYQKYQEILKKNEVFYGVISLRHNLETRRKRFHLASLELADDVVGRIISGIDIMLSYTIDVEALATLLKKYKVSRGQDVFLNYVDHPRWNCRVKIPWRCRFCFAMRKDLENISTYSVSLLA